MIWISLFLLISSLHSNVNVVTPDDCDVLFEGVDLESKLFRLELAPTSIIHFTPPQLKNDMQMRDLLEGIGRLSKIGGDSYLFLDIVINSPQAKQLYGPITAGSQMKITLVNKDEILIRVDVDSPAIQTSDRAGYKYAISASLDNKTKRQLQKSEIDKWGIVYASGYEEYTIYEVDFFINQLACLNRE